ncbi:MAG TPA: ketopantoate reductase C-terminal domain-containing protein, partial [Actinomycetota bacterium]|nr:ketopantoate reductase C-terminal domain-containing protein [Actinomycetota bacterium]
EALRDAFDGCTGLTALIPPDIQSAMWRKFLMIVSWSGVGAVTRAPIGAMLAVERTRQMMTAAMSEVLTLAHSLGIALPDDAALRTMEFLQTMPYEATASMQRDIMTARPSELESQNGAVVRLAAGAGVSVPVNELIYASLLPMELKARSGLEGVTPIKPSP